MSIGIGSSNSSSQATFFKTPATFDVGQVAQSSPTTCKPPIDSCDTGCQPVSAMPVVDDAYIHVAVIETTQTVIDPLYVVGTAAPGATVKVQNPDRQGWPVIAEVKADAVTGAYKVEVTDLKLFGRGDRVFVTAEEAGRKVSEGVLKSTSSKVETTHVHQSLMRGRVVNESRNVSTAYHGFQVDDVPPYYDQKEVTSRFTKTGSGATLLLTGANHAVPPGSTVSIGSAQVVADRFGRFELQLENLRLDSVLTVKVKDPHGRVSDRPLKVPGARLSLEGLVAGSRLEGNRLNLDAPCYLSAGDKLAVRRESGELQMLTADEHGSIKGCIEGVRPFETLQFSVAGNNQTTQLSSAVVVPGHCDALLDLDGVRVTNPTLEQSLAGAQAVLKPNCEPAVNLPEICGLPAFGKVVFQFEGQTVGELRADERGNTPRTSLAGISPGQELQVITFDAAGRRLGVDVSRWTAPNTSGASSRLEVRRRAENTSLTEMASMIGTGRLDAGTHADVKESRLEIRPNDSYFGSSKNRIDPAALSQEDQDTLGVVPGNETYLTFVTAEWSGDSRNIVYSTYDHATNKRAQHQLIAPLPYGDDRAAVEGQRPLPEAIDCLMMLKRAKSLAHLARELGKRPGDAEYDAPIRAAHASLFLLDRLAVQNPGAAQSLRESAEKSLAGWQAEPIASTEWVAPSDSTPVTSQEALEQFSSALLHADLAERVARPRLAFPPFR